MNFKILVFNYYFLTKVFENVFVNSFLHTDDDPMLTVTVTFKLNVCIACRRCWCAFVRDSGHRLVWTCSWQRVSSVSWLAYRRQFIWALRNGLKRLLPPHSSGVEKRVRRSQIAGWLTGVDRHIALTSVKKLRRANRWLSPAVQLFPSADTDCCACKKSEVWEISIFVEAVTAVSCWCSTKETASKRRHFSLYPSKCGIHVSSNTSTVLWKGLRIAAMSSRETRIAFVQRSSSTQSEKDKTTQISKIQNYMVPCTCRRRGRAPFSLNFLSTDQMHASGREAQPRSFRQNRPASEYIIWHNAHSPANRCSGCSNTCTEYEKNVVWKL